MSLIEQLSTLDNEELVNLHQAMSNDSQLFAQICLPHIIRKGIPDFHKPIYTALDKRHRYMSFVLFRGSGKSTLSHSIKGLHNICFQKEKYIVFISESIDQAAADLIGIQDEIVSNDMIQMLFGELKGKIWNVEESEFANGVDMPPFIGII